MKAKYTRPTLVAVPAASPELLGMSTYFQDGEGDAKRRAAVFDDEEEEESFIQPLQNSARYFGYTTYKDMQDELLK